MKTSHRPPTDAGEVARGVVRVGVSLEPELLGLLDAWVGERNSRSRSDAVRALIRKEVAHRTLADPDADALGVVALLYRHSTPNVLRRLMAAEHRWGEHVRSTTHVHLEGDACAEVVLLFGRRREVEKAAEDLRGVKGVLEGSWLDVAPSVAGGRTGHHHPHRPAT
ncbi:MAG TPA: CopG family ribbon-helix-helix protein [Thermoplasmata archaeon]|jgi:CopG family nickel-responsive transcriptional regulator|nr:CopG family ribbon-helix-helix protein [Thermoplasmata archaeon]